MLLHGFIVSQRARISLVALYPSYLEPFYWILSLSSFPSIQFWGSLSGGIKIVHPNPHMYTPWSLVMANVEWSPQKMSLNLIGFWQSQCFLNPTACSCSNKLSHFFSLLGYCHSLEMSMLTTVKGVYACLHYIWSHLLDSFPYPHFLQSSFEAVSLVETWYWP